MRIHFGDRLKTTTAITGLLGLSILALAAVSPTAAAPMVARETARAANGTSAEPLLPSAPSSTPAGRTRSPGEQDADSHSAP